MIGLFGSLNLAASSLAAQQEAMSVAGQNMANVNNSAYAEEQAVIEPSAPLETSAGEEGTGDTVVSITETRNSLLDSQITAETSVTGSYSTQQSALQNAEAYLGEQISSSSSSSSSTTGSTGGLADMLSSLFNSFSSMTTGSGNAATVVQAAQELTSQFNQVSANLGQVQSNLNTSVENDAASCDQDLKQIASLNQQIVLAQAAGGTANQLVDTREQTIEKLAGMVNISTSTQANGSINISIGGTTMVSGNTAIDGIKTYDAGGGQLLIEDGDSNTPLDVTGGSIGGAITARDGGLASLQSSLNTLASQLITQVNTVYSAGYNSSGGTGQNFFTGSTAADIGVNSSLVSDPSQFQGSSTASGGDTQVALALTNLATQSNAALGNKTFSQNYAQTVSNLGNAIDTATEQLNTSQAVSTTLTNQRSSESGVSIDQEMTNLMQFQKAYEASAELVSAISKMMETVISMGKG
jgi:flagellar hook-associated protein 1 FlgK